MTLREYLHLNRLTQAEFAELTGIDKTLIQKYVSKGSLPKPDKMKLIYIYTNGLVTSNDFYGLSQELIVQFLSKLNAQKEIETMNKEYENVVTEIYSGQSYEDADLC